MLASAFVLKVALKKIKIIFIRNFKYRKVSLTAINNIAITVLLLLIEYF